MDFDSGRAFPTEEQDRLYVYSERYRLDLFDHGKAGCFMCKKDSVHKDSEFKESEPGYLVRNAKCNSCFHTWQEVYALAGCRYTGYKSEHP